MLETHIGTGTQRQTIYAQTLLCNQEETEIYDWHATMPVDEMDSIIAQRLAWVINLSDINELIYRFTIAIIFFS